MNAMSNQAGMPHSSTLRKPLLYTARISTTARNNQIMSDSRPLGREGSIAHTPAAVQNGVTV